jgi:hypothetical protein
MEADAAAEERKASQAEAAANAPTKWAPGRPRKLLGFAALPLKPVPNLQPEGASKPKADWWQPPLILPILREFALRQNFATAVVALAHRFPTLLRRAGLMRDRALIIKNLGSTVASIKKNRAPWAIKKNTPGGNRGGNHGLRYAKRFF